MKTKKDLIKALMKLEGKKKQVDVAQMSEIVSHLSKLSKEDFRVIKVLLS